MGTVQKEMPWYPPEDSETGKAEKCLCAEIRETFEKWARMENRNSPEANAVMERHEQLIRMLKLSRREFIVSQTSDLGKWYELARSLATGFMVFLVEAQEDGNYLVKFRDGITRRCCAELLLNGDFERFMVLEARFFSEYPKSNSDHGPAEPCR